MNLRRICDADNSQYVSLVPKEAWETVYDRHGIPVSDYLEEMGLSRAIATVVNSNYQDAYGSTRSVSHWWRDQDLEVPEKVREIEHLDSKSIVKKAEAKFGTIEEWVDGCGVVVFYSEEGDEEPCGYYSVWDNTFSKW